MELDMGEKTTYLVMETHPAYVVLLDSEGRFLKAANCGYERGDRIDTAILIEYPQDKRRRRRRALRTAVSLAACVALAVLGVQQYRYVFVPYGTLQMEINPGVEMEISRSGRVVGLTGTNADGEALVEDYDYEGKDRYEAADELADLAVEMQFLEEGGQIALTAEAESAQWVEDTERRMKSELEEHLADHSIRVVISTDPEEEVIQEETESVTIPAPQQTTPVQEDAEGAQQAPASPAAPAAPDAPAAETPQAVQPPVSDDDGDSGYGDDDGDDGDDDDGDDDGDD